VDTYVVEFEPGQDRLEDAGVAETAAVVVVLAGVAEVLVLTDDDAVAVEEVVTSRAFHTPLFTAVPREDFI